MKEIKLTQGKVALVDDEDFEYLNQWKWYAYANHGNFYAVRGSRKGGHYKNIRMHRVLINAPDDKQVDHIDHNGLNNQKSNLRLCSQVQNSWNRQPNKDNKSKYKGVIIVKCVYKGKESKYIYALIKRGVKQQTLGRFETEEDAARAYDKAALEFFGEFANLNFK